MRPHSADTHVYPQVENEVWHLSAALLAHRSEVFSDMLSLPRATHAIEGHYEWNPITLPGISAEDFGWLVKYFKGDSLYVKYYCTALPADKISALHLRSIHAKVYWPSFACRIYTSSRTLEHLPWKDWKILCISR